MVWPHAGVGSLSAPLSLQLARGMLVNQLVTPQAYAEYGGKGDMGECLRQTRGSSALANPLHGFPTLIHVLSDIVQGSVPYRVQVSSGVSSAGQRHTTYCYKEFNGDGQLVKLPFPEQNYPCECKYVPHK